MVTTAPGRNTRVVALCDCSRALSVSSGVSGFPTNDITGDESHVRPVEADSSADGRGPVSADCPEGTDVHALSPAINPIKSSFRIIKTPYGKNSTGVTRSEERRVGKSVSVRVDLGGRRIIKKKK